MKEKIPLDVVYESVSNSLKHSKITSRLKKEELLETNRHLST